MLNKVKGRNFPNIELGLRTFLCGGMQMMTDPSMSNSELDDFKSFWTEFKKNVQHATRDLELDPLDRQKMTENLNACERRVGS